jgi:hypothetical protein
MKILIEVGTDIVDVFPDCDVERSLARYADQVADAARELYPEADVVWRIDTLTGFGLRIDGLDDTETLRTEADRIWEEQTWLVDPRAEALGEGARHQQGRLYTLGRECWLVLTDDEADEAAGEEIRDGLWAFRPDFLAQFSPTTPTPRYVAALAKLQEKLCEDAQPLIEALVDIDDVVTAAIRADGRGHWIADYDGQEVELAGGFYGYRVG